MDRRGGGDQIQKSIDTCIDWAKDWQMEFNLSKCTVFGMGKNNKKRFQDARGNFGACQTGEGSGGGKIYMRGKQTAQCQAAIGKANRVLGCIRRGVIFNQKRCC